MSTDNRIKPLRGYSVGIIPDGNRRWARQNNRRLDEAYWLAMKKLAVVVDGLLRLGAASVAIYALSRDNLERPRGDLAAVCRAEERFLRELLPTVKRAHRATAFHAGRADLLPAAYREALGNVCDPSRRRRDSVPSVFICAAYDPCDEVTACWRRNAQQREDVVASLWVPRTIDLVIRTGGDCRLSGFLPLQCKYAEFFFEPYYFPDINQRRVRGIVRQFLKRKRRFGKGGTPTDA